MRLEPEPAPGRLLISVRRAPCGSSKLDDPALTRSSLPPPQRPPTGLPPFNNILAGRSFRALQLRDNPIQTFIDLVNRWGNRLFGFQGLRSVFEGFNGL